MKPVFSPSVLTSSVFLSLVVFLNTSVAQTTYTVTEIGKLPICTHFSIDVYGINDAGAVVGACYSLVLPGPSTPYPFLFDGALHQLGTAPGTAFAINNSGEVVGELGGFVGNSSAFRYDGVMHDLGTLPGGSRAKALAINNSGIPVGSAHNRFDDEVAFRFIGNMQPFGSLPGDTSSSANGISDAGTIVGWSFGTTGGIPLFRAFGFVESRLPRFQYLGTLPSLTSSVANAINNAGQIVGRSFTLCPGNCPSRAWLYDGTMHDLGVPGEQSDASAINDAGEVVGAFFNTNGGWHAYRYANGQVYNLNDYLDPVSGAGWTLQFATGINASGQIAGVGIHNNQMSGFVLTPVSPAQQVTIDIKPGDPSNTINLRSNGVIPVAILSSASFDALQVDPATVMLAGAAVKVTGKSGHFLAHAEDVNGDGLPDLLCQVYTNQFTVEEGATTAVLEATTFGGQLVQGEDAITIVP